MKFDKPSYLIVIIFLHLIQSTSSQVIFLLFLSSKPYQISTFFDIGTAILQNKNSISDEINALSTFAYWKGSFSNPNVNSLPEHLPTFTRDFCLSHFKKG